MTSLPASSLFIGREKALQRLGEIYRERQNLLLVGPAGMGKSALLVEFARDHPLLLARRCGHLGDLLAELEPQVGLAHDHLTIAKRIHLLVNRLKELCPFLVLDNVAKSPPRVAHFVRAVLDFSPVWLVVRSELAHDVGHVWPYFYGFERVHLDPFSIAETHKLFAQIDFPGDRLELQAAALRLHHLAGGNPGALTALLAEMRVRTYDLHSVEGLKLIALHARISDVEAQIADSRI
jgi:hypothetical protein